ncbi:hypothetical protein [Actinoallomurus sp. CA-150999]|uniref:hypothetical protein n=1 Tax=Actinoallomurus sp. CA-150999 TaxID=3239887 RepID=UPI003D89FBC4
MELSDKIAVLAIFAVRAALGVMSMGWVLMVTIATAHEVWWPAVPEIGYWHAVQLGLPVAILGCSYLVGLSRGSNN